MTATCAPLHTLQTRQFSINNHHFINHQFLLLPPDLRILAVRFLNHGDLLAHLRGRDG